MLELVTIKRTFIISFVLINDFLRYIFYRKFNQVLSLRWKFKMMYLNYFLTILIINKNYKI